MMLEKKMQIAVVMESLVYIYQPSFPFPIFTVFNLIKCHQKIAADIISNFCPFFKKPNKDSGIMLGWARTICKKTIAVSQDDFFFSWAPLYKLLKYIII